MLLRFKGFKLKQLVTLEDWLEINQPILSTEFRIYKIGGLRVVQNAKLL
jgi:hypothetical protein